MAEVFVVHHAFDEGGVDETKLIGVYSTSLAAEAAVARLRAAPGFRERPDGFHVDRYVLDQDHWCEGFGPSSADSVGS